MADLVKEMREALAEGIRRLIQVERAAIQHLTPDTGRTVGTNIPYRGASGIGREDQVTTGYDPVTGETTVAFVLGVSEMDGEDIFSA